VNCLAARGPAPIPKCQHLQHIVDDVQLAIDHRTIELYQQADASERERLINEVARRHVGIVIDSILEQSDTLRDLADQGRIAIVGCLYDVSTGTVEMLPHPASQFTLVSAAS
jgi:carbonic anhydrase/SulP family sulfate permease